MLFKNKRNLIETLFIIFLFLIASALIIIKFSSIEYAIGRFFSILTPFYIGFAIAYILNRPISFIEKRFSLSRPLVIACVYIGLIVIISTFIGFMLPRIVDSALKLASDTTKWVSSQSFDVSAYNIGPLQTVIQENLTRLTGILSQVSNFLIDNLTRFFVSVTGTLLQIIFGIIISIYMLADKKKMISLFKNLVYAFFSKKNAKHILEFANNVNEIFSHFISGLIVEALIVGSLAFVGFSLLGVPYALVLGVIICFTNVIPYMGPFLGAIPAVVSTLIYDPVKALWVLIFIIVLQQFDGNFIGPKVMGNYIGLAPLWIILSITIGGGYAGVLGIILAIPTGAILKIVFSEIIEKQKQKKQASKKNEPSENT